MECPAPVAPYDGYIKIVNFTGTYIPGTVARHFCSPGFRLAGNTVRTCTPAGDWTGESPSCLAVSCGEPPPRNKTSVTLLNTTTTTHSLALYHCLQPYSINQSSPGQLRLSLSQIISIL